MELDISKLNKNISFEDFLVSCKIPGIGQVVSKQIAEKVINVSTLRDLLEEKEIKPVLMEISGIGPKTIESITESLLNLDFMFLLEEMEDENFLMFQDNIVYPLNDLLENGIKEEKVKIEKDLSFLSDLTNIGICITGTLSQPRKYFENFIRNKHGIFQTTVTRNTDILIYSPIDGTDTTKYNKAIQLQNSGYPIKIITEIDFYDYFR